MIGAVAMAASTVLSSLPVYAAVTTMPDGGQFDATYYATTYPDVAAALGTDANVLYQHYKTFGAKEGRQPYASGTATTTTAQTRQMSAAAKKTAKKILNQYRTKNSSWDHYFETTYDVGVRNPYYAITDLNNDGVYELYICVDPSSYSAWDFITLNNDGSYSYISTICAYNTSQNLYMYLWDMEYDLCTFDGKQLNCVMALYTEGGLNTQFEVYYSDGTTAQMSDDEAEAIISTFLPIDNLVQARPLTKANINAIK